MRALFVWLPGCAELLPLSEVPISGGTDPQRAAAREELAAFDAAIGPGRLTLREIRFEEPPPGALGAYTRRVVTLEPRMAPEVVYSTLRHELCHALDFHENLARRADLFEELAAGLFDPETGTLSPDLVPTAMSQRQEAFAQFCHLGPLVARMLVEPCPPEPAEVTEVGDFLDSFVWTDFSLPTVRLAAGPVASLHNDWAPDLLIFEGTEQARTIHASLFRFADGPDGLVEGERSVFVDLYEGTEVPSQTPDSIYTELPEELPPELFLQAKGWLTGPAAALGSVPLHHLGFSEPRLLVWSEASWARVSGGCARSAEHLFAADGRVWSAWAEDTTVSWSELRIE